MYPIPGPDTNPNCHRYNQTRRSGSPRPGNWWPSQTPGRHCMPLHEKGQPTSPPTAPPPDGILFPIRPEEKCRWEVCSKREVPVLYMYMSWGNGGLLICVSHCPTLKDPVLLLDRSAQVLCCNEHLRLRQSFSSLAPAFRDSLKCIMRFPPSLCLSLSDASLAWHILCCSGIAHWRHGDRLPSTMRKDVSCETRKEFNSRSGSCG